MHMPDPTASGMSIPAPSMETQSTVSPGMKMPPWEPRYYRMTVSSGILLCLTTIWTIARIYSRRLSKARFQIDDYVYFIAQFFFYGVCACAIALVAVGRPTDKSIIATKFRIMFPMRLCYAMTLFFVKLSVILLVRRIFAQTSRAIRIGTLIAIILSISWAVYASTIEFVQCTPYASSWDPTIPQEKCIDKEVAYGLIPIMDIPIELLILVLPIKPILKLNIAKPHKIALLFVFCAGLVTVAFSGVYLYYILHNFHVSYMIGIVHGGIALLVASSTALQPLFNHVISPWFKNVMRTAYNKTTRSRSRYGTIEMSSMTAGEADDIRRPVASESTTLVQSKAREPVVDEHKPLKPQKPQETVYVAPKPHEPPQNTGGEPPSYVIYC